MVLNRKEQLGSHRNQVTRGSHVHLCCGVFSQKSDKHIGQGLFCEELIRWCSMMVVRNKRTVV